MVFDWGKAVTLMTLLINRGYAQIQAGLQDSWPQSSVLIWRQGNGIISRKDTAINPGGQGNLISGKELPGIKAFHSDGITRVWYPCYEWRSDGLYYDWPDWAIDIFRFELSKQEGNRRDDT